MLGVPKIVQTAAVQIAFIPLTVPRERIREVMGPGIGEVLAALAGQGKAPAGPWFSHHLRMHPAVFEVEICVPVAAPVSPVGRVLIGWLRPEKVLRTVYRGPYEGLAAAWGEFNGWIAAAGYLPRPDLWECYLAGPESGPDPAHWRTELNRPLLD